jgi:hypothetical protein
MVSGLDILGVDALANGLDYAGALVPQDNGECTFGVFAGECVGICGSVSGMWLAEELVGNKHTCVTDAGVVYLYAYFVGLGGSDFNVLDGEFFSSFPSYGCLRWISVRPSVESLMIRTLQVIVYMAH